MRNPGNRAGCAWAQPGGLVAVAFRSSQVFARDLRLVGILGCRAGTAHACLTVHGVELSASTGTRPLVGPSGSHCRCCLGVVQAVDGTSVPPPCMTMRAMQLAHTLPDSLSDRVACSPACWLTHTALDREQGLPSGSRQRWRAAAVRRLLEALVTASAATCGDCALFARSERLPGNPCAAKRNGAFAGEQQRPPPVDC